MIFGSFYCAQSLNREFNYSNWLFTHQNFNLVYRPMGLLQTFAIAVLSIESHVFCHKNNDEHTKKSRNLLIKSQMPFLNPEIQTARSQFLYQTKQPNLKTGFFNAANTEKNTIKTKNLSKYSSIKMRVFLKIQIKIQKLCTCSNHRSKSWVMLLCLV